jgi:hypothetical protein
LHPTAIKLPSPIKGDATKFVINHWLKPVAYSVGFKMLFYLGKSLAQIEISLPARGAAIAISVRSLHQAFKFKQCQG